MRVLKASIVLICAGASVVAFTEYLGARVAARHDAERLAEVKAVRQNLAAYRRELTFGTPIDQNAAVWYSLTFARMAAVPDAGRREIGQAAGESFTRLGPETEAAIERECREVRDARLRAALRCARCDWLESTTEDPPNPLALLQALLVGNCLIVSGHARAVHHNWPAAADSYAEALAFAGDLGRSDYGMNLVGLAVAELAWRAVGELVAAAGDGAGLLTDLQAQAAGWKRSLPTVEIGVRLAHLDLAHNVEIRARVRAGRSRAGAAWFMFEDRRILALLRALADARDPATAAAVVGEIDRETVGIADPIIKRSVPEQLQRAIDVVGYVRRLAYAVEGAIRLQQWHATHGSYPSTDALVSWRFDAEGLRYEPLGSGAGYRVVVAQGFRAGTILVHGGATG